MSPNISQHDGPSPSLRTATFECVRCGLLVSALTPGDDRRNHCPSCLHSRHTLDHVAGGASDCGARMAPLSIAVLRNGSWALVHRCTRCHELAMHPVSGDDNQLVLMRLAVRPLAEPPFPLEVFGDL
ncbi:RNHCP domain-containing protein [Nocardia puris]|uniref:RNHCP domain-containing protein n=1 Tax=Nocardia puris TaxID=208602 RepID=A0A366DUG3_9NOCA|nr:RNHCP domain-containing protein [Nocardia puris]MBF6215282.1 RNHCP domain-containing protein [Nocardia puris]MBF6364223.1 RNHCP domain-containing protein [Nocardia puris]MBF6459152.1 RNHCP domain-containing protein [Nocardia puris]RBO92894.1 RNHCP domain-containing protein [Nocardia puris]